MSKSKGTKGGSDTCSMPRGVAGVFVILIFGTLIFIAGMRFASHDALSPIVLDSDLDSLDSAVSRPSPVDSGSTSDVLSVRENDAVRGDAPILLIEYSDYECPFCKRFHPTVQALVDSGEVTWVYRHLPLPFHATADEGAIIAECVRVRKGNDAFWAYTDAVFEADTPSLALYRSLGGQAGVSSAEIDGCLASDSPESAHLQSHMQEAQLFGINGTPGSFLVDTRTGKFQRIPGAIPLESDGSGPSIRDLFDALRS